MSGAHAPASTTRGCRGTGGRSRRNSTPAGVARSKPLPYGWILREYANAEVGPHPPGHGCYWDEHELEHVEPGRRLQQPKWEWTELDGQTLVWAEQGCLYRAPLGREGVGSARLLVDFNDMRFERIAAPY